MFELCVREVNDGWDMNQEVKDCMTRVNKLTSSNNLVEITKSTKRLIEQLEKETGKKVILKEEIKDTEQVVYKVNAVQKGYGTSIVIACKAGMNSALRDKKVMEYFKNFVNFKNYNAPIEITYDYLGSLKLLK